MKNIEKRILIITGETSGELLAVDVVKELKKINNYEFVATGGELLKKEGVEIIESIEKMSVVGLVEVLQSYSFLKELMKRILEIIQKKKISYVLLVDYPGFNLRLAKKIKKIDKNIKIFYLVSPQIWAWNYKRIKIIKENIDFMFVLFPFEEEIYKKENIPVEWIGHPLKVRIPKEIRKQKQLSIKGKPVIGILPGSRLSEVSKLLLPMLNAANLLQKRYPKAEFFLPLVSNNSKLVDYVNQFLTNYNNLKIKVLENSSLQVMKNSDVLIIASGTATLEAAYFKKPMIICYKINNFSYLIFSRLVQTEFIGLPNLLCEKQVALELLQNEVDAENIFNEAVKILENEAYRSEIIKNLKKIKFTPGNKNPAKIAADIMVKQME